MSKDRIKEFYRQLFPKAYLVYIAHPHNLHVDRQDETETDSEALISDEEIGSKRQKKEPYVLYRTAGGVLRAVHALEKEPADDVEVLEFDDEDAALRKGTATYLLGCCIPDDTYLSKFSLLRKGYEIISSIIQARYYTEDNVVELSEGVNNEPISRD